MSGKRHYHFIGIGGIGMSAIAQILHDRGESVSGSDRQENDVTRRLQAAGVKVCIGHSAANVNGADVVIYSAAISRDNPEMMAARAKGLEILERPEMLGRLMEPYQHRIAVSGTHGKTTTTSMIDVILDRAGLDASALIGGDLSSIGGNARLGGGSIILTEACEAFESFLHLHPSIAVITNIDADHMEYYGTIERIEDSFRQFISQVDEDGCVIACWDDERVRKVMGDCGCRAVSYGLHETAEVRAVSVDISSPQPSYDLVVRGERLGLVRLGAPGEHNVVNSLGAAAAALEMGVGFEDVRDGLAAFRGAARRFDVLYSGGGAMVVDDYAHHPAEIRATLKGARAAYGKRVIAVFQPHLFSRTKIFMDDFADALKLADEVIVTAIYASREKPMDGVTAEGIVDRMRQSGYTSVRYVPDKDAIFTDLARQVGDGDVVIVLGAGDIRTVGEGLADMLSRRSAVL